MTLFKQYGEMRTGTNYLRYTLLNNFKGFRLYVNEFGWKHGFFDAPPKRSGNNTLINHMPESFKLKSHEEWVDSEISGDENSDRRALIKTDLNSKKLIYLISYKRFADWAYSLGQWGAAPGIENLKLDELANRFLFKYTKWHSLFPEAEVIYFNDLITEDGAKKILSVLEEKFNLTRVRGEFFLEKRKISPFLTLTDIQFQNSIYLNREYLKPLSEDFVKKLLEKEREIESRLPTRYLL